MIQKTRKLSSFVLSTLLAVTTFALSGCGGGDVAPDTRPDRVLFGGVAKLSGLPVADALITFHPVGTGNGSSGKTDAKGNFTMSTFAAGDGAVPGEYQVTLSKVVATATDSGVSDEDDNYDGGPSDDEEPVEANTLPPKFESPTTSGVTVTVKEANTEFVLEFK